MTTCYCASGALYQNCCQPFLEEMNNAAIALPKTPEQLMRSRYSAYATQNAQYIYNTYSAASRAKQSIADIANWAKACKWVNLIIHQHSIEADQTTGHVEFSAFFIEDKQLYVLREHSRFLKLEQQWFYHDGEIISNTVLSQVKRNQPCPCQQGKKFKQCCGRYLG